MKQFFKKILLFVPFCFALYLIGIVVWGEFIPSKYINNLRYKIGSIGQMQLRLQEAKRIKNVDILFIGSSAAYRGFDTRIFKKYGINSFNLGSSAQTPIQTLYLLRRYLMEINPKLLVIDANPLMLSIDGTESALDIISNDSFNKGMVDMALSLNSLKVYHTLLYAWYASVFGEDKPPIDTVRNGDKYISGGFVEHELAFFKHINYEKQEWEYRKIQLRAFDKIIEYLKTIGVKYIIVQTPITPKLYASFANNSFIDSFLEKRGSYYNFNQLITLNDSLHFLDANHLNQQGVEIYNNKLAEILFKDNLF